MKTKLSTEELIALEARKLARDQLERELSIKNLPLPKESALELHIDQLIAAVPELTERAERHVKGRTDAYTLGLQDLGIVPVLDLELDLGSGN